MSKHAIENLIAEEAVIDRAFAAMSTAKVTGSTGATEIRETRLPTGKLESDSTTVSRISSGFGEKFVGTNAFRIGGIEGSEVVIVATSASAHRHELMEA